MGGKRYHRLKSIVKDANPVGSVSFAHAIKQLPDDGSDLVAPQLPFSYLAKATNNRTTGFAHDLGLGLVANNGNLIGPISRDFPGSL